MLAAVSGKSQAKANGVIAEQEAEGPKPVAALMDNLLSIDTDLWDNEMKKAFLEDVGVSAKSLISETQRIMEAVVFGLDSGSMAQRVEAEYLKELVSRIETVEKQK